MKRNTWFNLARHDDPPQAEPPADPPAEPPATGDSKDLAAEVEKWKALSRKNEAQAKANADAAKKLADIEAAQKSESEKLSEAKENAEKRAQVATARAVKAEVKALAADGFADASDAAAFLDTSKYVGDDGEIDTEAIKADLADLLAAKPHLAKPTGPTQPKPDPGQGGRPPVVTDFAKADQADFAAEAAKYKIRPRTPA